MKASDILVLSLRQLKERKLRSILTILAIAVGVTSIIALSAQVEGVSQSITGELEKLGPDTVMVTVRGTTLFTDADVIRLKELEGVSEVTPILGTRVSVTGIDDPVSLVGVASSDLVSLLGEVKLLDGSMYFDAPAPQALIGYSVAKDEIGQTRYEVGQPILVQMGQRPIMMTVVGVLDTYGALLTIQPDDAIFIPIDYVKTLSSSGTYTIIMVQAESTEKVDLIVELIGYIFGGRASVTSIKQITGTVISITSQINLLLIGIAGISFIAAGLGTFNIMMISVLERVREIGILKALGMKDKGVLALYLTQGLLAGLFGSLAGLGLGAIVAYAIPIILGGLMAGAGPENSIGANDGQSMGAGFRNIRLSYTPAISLTYLGIATAMSIAVTLLSSAYPAWKASRLNPVEALRYE